MKKRGNLFSAMAGILAGAALAGPVAHAGMEYLEAKPAAQAIYVDGVQVELEAYNIQGSNYVKLRDVGEAVGFNVYWDGAVQIDSDAPYTGLGPEEPKKEELQKEETTEAAVQEYPEYRISQEHWSREDFSQQANPAVFTGVYTRELYNVIRQTMVDKDQQSDPGYLYAYTMVTDEDYSEVKQLLGCMDGLEMYQHHVPKNFMNYYMYLDYLAVSIEIPENFLAPLEFIQPVIAEAEKLGTDSEKITYLNDYICTLLTYERKATSGITQTFTEHSEELAGACGSYCRALKFLCAAMDIPCFTISSANHVWNMVYADGAWLHVDVATNDAYGWNSILLAETVNKEDRAPEVTAFLKELYIPGSTK